MRVCVRVFACDVVHGVRVCLCARVFGGCSPPHLRGKAPAALHCVSAVPGSPSPVGPCGKPTAQLPVAAPLCVLRACPHTFSLFGMCAKLVYTHCLTLSALCAWAIGM